RCSGGEQPLPFQTMMGDPTGLSIGLSVSSSARTHLLQAANSGPDVSKPWVSLTADPDKVGACLSHTRSKVSPLSALHSGQPRLPRLCPLSGVESREPVH